MGSLRSTLAWCQGEWLLTVYGERPGPIAFVAGSRPYINEALLALGFALPPVRFFAKDGRRRRLPLVGEEPPDGVPESSRQPNYRGRLDSSDALPLEEA